MGAALWIPLMLIVLVALGYVLWAVFAAGKGVAGAAGSATDSGTGETAPHTSERTKIRDSDTEPPPEYKP
ncbi:hypothetical protein [Kribbella sp. CA-294648]|uniref:hypothetical protein n=1 Tax=Kribbella sp. CA-294648 TaxID=3239948 RepID=UPI003D90958F